jgi:predicted enzyme related to lactoylglutathione lyase
MPAKYRPACESWFAAGFYSGLSLDFHRLEVTIGCVNPLSTGISVISNKTVTMKTIGVMHMLLVQDMKRAIDFYQNAFDCKVLQQSDFWTNLDCGHGKIALCTFGNKTELKETTLIIEVDNHKEAAEKVKVSGGKVLKISAPYEGAPVYNVMIVDTENNQIVASETVRG